ncbi:MAG: ribbon-helix-helix domain-containing protein [Clostridia bacterium]|nr:ribbon-helix-helix domain-containing protein [Clostridia bacterium]
MSKGNTINRTRISITIDPELNDKLNKYIVSQNFKKSKSYYVEQAIKMYIHQDEKVLAKQIEDSIKFNIKTFEDRYCRILAKGVKRIYANTKILLNMLAYMSNSENDTRFLLETLNEAEIDGYKVLKNGIIERDIEDLFPKEELVRKANKIKEV